MEEDSMIIIVFFGIILWSTLFLLIRKAFPKRSFDFCNRLVSTIHASLAVTLASLSVQDWRCPVCPVASTSSPKQRKTLAVTAAYLIYDFGCCLFDKQVRIDNLVHHLVCVVGIGAGFAYKLCGSEMVAALWITEISSPFLHLRELLKELGYRDTDLNFAADVLFAVIFSIARMIGGPYLSYVTLSADNPIIIKVTETLVSNGCVNYKGNIADKGTTGGWKASPFIIVNEVAERLAFFAVAVSMVSYLVFEMHQSLPDAATHVNDWIGAAYVLTLVGAFLADAYFGRFLTIIIFSFIYLMGMILLTLSASIDSLRPPQCTKRPCTPSTNTQTSFLYGALYLIALGTGGIKPCVSTFGADQFDELDKKESQKKYAFFNWFFFAINMGALLGITLLVYVQQEKGWTWGFGVPTIVMFTSIVVLIVGFKKYRYKKPMGSVFTRFVQVIVVSIRNHFRGVVVVNESELYEMKTKESDFFGARKLPHTKQYRFLDKAAVVTDHEIITNNKWKLCTITQVEEFKSFIRILPIWASTIALSISFAQLSTFFLTQANIMGRKLGPHFTIPSGSVPVFTALNGLLLVPIYEKFVVPYLRSKTGHRRGITSLQRIGVGLFVSIFALMSAALVERMRRTHPNPKGLSVFWLFPQFFLIGIAEVFSYVGQLEFFYDEATDGTRSISSALFLSEIGIGSWLSSAIVKIIQSASGGVEEGWIRNNLNNSKLDYFYWILTAINGVNFLVYLIVAWRYKGRNYERGTIRDESNLIGLDGQFKKENDTREFSSMAS